MACSAGVMTDMMAVPSSDHRGRRGRSWLARPLTGPWPLRVLIIEDDVEAAQHMADDLASYDLDVTVLNDGAAALEPGAADGPYQARR